MTDIKRKIIPLMPGRFTLTSNVAAIREAFAWLDVPGDIHPRYNIAPTQPVAVALNDGRNQVDLLSWGLIPSYSSAKMTSLLINARSEGVSRSPSFRGSFKRKRCLVLADGVFEWVKIPRKREKIPYWVHMKTKRPFAFAGLWDSWTSMDGSEIKSCCVITTEPNELVRQIHHRMAVVLHEKDYQTWLQEAETESKDLLPLLKPYPGKEMAYYQVSTLVSNARNESPETVVAVGPTITL